jgi:hypothetical protein
MFVIVYRHVSSRVCLTLKDGTDRLSRNVDKLPAYVAKHRSKRMLQNVKLSFFLSKHHAMRAFGGEGIAPSVLIPESDGRQGAAPRCCHFTTVLNCTVQENVRVPALS